MCHLDWAMGCPDMWPNILGVSIRVHLDKINVYIRVIVLHNWKAEQEADPPPVRILQPDSPRTWTVALPCSIAT